QKEYRHPIRSWQYEFPCGAIDDGEEPEHTAIREVKEETGCEVKTIRSLGVVYPSFGATDETIHLFVAEIIVPEDVDINDDSDTHGRELLEEIKMEAVTEAQLDQLVASGEFSHGAGLAAIARWKLCRD
nr:NUDIX hydrolase [Lachnospiraceae bacterium]